MRRKAFDSTLSKNAACVLNPSQVACVLHTRADKDPVYCKQLMWGRKIAEDDTECLTSRKLI